MSDVNMALGLVLWVVAVTKGWQQLSLFQRHKLGYKVACRGALVVLVVALAFGTCFLGKGYYSPQSNVDSLTNTTVFKWLRDNCPPGTIVATNMEFEVSFFADCPSLSLPSRWWWKKWRIPSDMHSRLPGKMRQVGARYVVLFCGKRGLREEDYGDYVARLSRGENNDPSFNMIREGGFGVVYELKTPSLATSGPRDRGA